jgi:hypothetical protein
MYSSMMTPVWTETPKSARKPTPEETLKNVPVNRRAIVPPKGAKSDIHHDEQCPLDRTEHEVEKDEDQKDRDGNHEEQPGLSSFLALVLSRPVEVIATRQFHLLVHLSQ